MLYPKRTVSDLAMVVFIRNGYVIPDAITAMILLFKFNPKMLDKLLEHIHQKALDRQKVLGRVCSERNLYNYLNNKTQFINVLSQDILQKQLNLN